MRLVIRVSLLVAAVGGLAAGWLWLAPAQLPGGSASYVMPSGSSMLPTLREGDLAIVRAAPSYAPGDVVAYRSARLGETVLHRIVDVEDGRFVLKGDNNSWKDSDRPATEDVLGKLWVRIPGGGRVLGWARTPGNAAILAGSTALLLTGGVAGRRRKRRRRPDTSAREASRGAPRGMSGGLVVARGAAVFLSILALACAALAVAAYTQPPSRLVPTQVDYVQRGTFAYSAEVERGAVYPDGEALSGDPVFLRLAKGAELAFEYELQTQAPNAVAGSMHLAATLVDETGWSRTVLVSPPSGIEGGQGTVTAQLDLGGLVALMRKVEKATGVLPSYSLHLQAFVETNGTIAGRAVEASFSPELEFLVDELVLRMTPPEDPEAGLSDLLERSMPGSVRTTVETPNVVSAGPVAMEVERARLIALVVGGAALLALLVVVIVLLVGRRRDEASRIRARYGLRMIDVTGGGRQDRAVVDLDSIESLVRVADSYERMILHEHAGSAHHYLVEGDVSVYRYSARGAPTRPVPADIAAEISAVASGAGGSHPRA